METGSAAGQPAVSGDSITVTPAEGFKGVMVLRYTVMDKTDDVSRQTDGRVRITVRDKPDAPSAPAATDVRSRTAVLKWAPPSDNGATISKYTVRSNGFSQDCATTTCTLSGLTNDVKYVFTVTATNEVGESVPSPASNEIRPDEKPSPPEAPTVKAGDKNMVITWPAAKTEGSAVKNYNLEISPPPANGIAVKNGVAGLSYTWPGLTNGVRYKVRAQAVNELGPSEWGIYSAEDNPAGVPAAPAAPTTAVASAVGTSNQLKVNWTEPNTNGDAIKNYYVTMSGGGGTTQTQMVAGTVRTANFTANNSEAGYTFTVQAENKAGKGAVSAASAPRRATGKLGQVSGVSATAADTGGAGQGRGHQLPGTGRRRTQRLPARRGQLHLLREPQRQVRRDPPGPEGGRVHQRAATTITVTANSTVAPSSDASAGATATPYGVTRNPVGVRSGRRREPEEPELQLELAVDNDQRRCLHPDQHRQRRLGTGRRPREAGPSTPGGFSERTPDPGPDRQLPRHRRTDRLGLGPVRDREDPLDHPAQRRHGPQLHRPARTHVLRSGGAHVRRPGRLRPAVDVPLRLLRRHVLEAPRHHVRRGRPVVLHHARLAEPDAVDQFHRTPRLVPPAQSGVPNCTFPVGATP